MRARLIDPQEVLERKAEGLCVGLPYDTALVSSEGCSIHFWLKESDSLDMLDQAIRAARRERDIVGATWSVGEPIGFWAHQDITR